MDVYIYGHAHKKVVYKNSVLMFDDKNNCVTEKDRYFVLTSSWTDYSDYARRNGTNCIASKEYCLTKQCWVEQFKDLFAENELKGIEKLLEIIEAFLAQKDVYEGKFVPYEREALLKELQNGTVENKLSTSIILDEVVDVRENPININDFLDTFVDWIESNHWYFGVTIEEFEDDQDD